MERYFTKMFRLFDIGLQWNGFPIRKARQELLKIIAHKAQEHEQFIENKKREIVQYHLKNNSFYSKLIGTKNCKN